MWTLDAGGGGAQLGERINWWVRKIYLALIFTVIGLMAVHNALIFGRKAAALYRRSDARWLRMDLSAALAAFRSCGQFYCAGVDRFCFEVSRFLGGAFPGIGRKLPALDSSHRRGRAAAGRAWHFGYASATREGRRLVKDMLPGLKMRGTRRPMCAGWRAWAASNPNSAASATRRRWNIGPWSGARSSWEPPD